jgi:hypothetical protein
VGMAEVALRREAWVWEGKGGRQAQRDGRGVHDVCSGLFRRGVRLRQIKLEGVFAKKCLSDTYYSSEGAVFCNLLRFSIARFWVCSRQAHLRLPLLT